MQQQIRYAKVAAASNGSNEIVAAVAGKIIRVLGYHLSHSGTVNSKWQSASTDLTGLNYGTAGVIAHEDQTRDGHFETAAGEALNLNLSAGTAVGGYISYLLY